MQIQDQDKRSEALSKFLEGKANSEIKEERAKLGLSNNYADGGMAMGLGPLALKKMKEEGINSGGLLGMAMMSVGGPVNKIEYKSDGGEVKVSYGGPLAKG